ncbi:LysR substrate-binding domain-containing protein [Crenobacter sp. SG2305]|uniref:LysR substrate-binding domain-containing protein n=1 Tax=Crenobacter oryzisoli TaxID=3056844 RepID=UPI0025AA985D|nr:LysR substrate-binding domain-containing protein [Crenobacter sp. SG2305]MDN0083197.1 LysR substrate-binding domain-containing protein [Crenobacter sp. SG2305]
METRWLEDFLVLAETGSFTRSAQARHLTQPAFSRRIKALESWVGTELIDRTAYPTTLTPAGAVFREQAIVMLNQIQATRALLQGMKPLPEETLEFAVPHTLSFSFFPKWLTELEESFGPLACRLQASNVHDALLALVEGGTELLMCYHHPKKPIELEESRYEGLRLGVERLRPYSRCNRERQPRFTLPGSQAQPVPFLGYAANAYFRLMTELILDNAPEPCHLKLRYETDMAEGLKNMVLEGHGVAFLPQSAVSREVRNGQLAPAADASWGVDMEIRLYRSRKPSRPAVEEFWTFLKSRYSPI